MLSLQTNFKDQNKVFSVILASKFIVKGSGGDPSFDRKMSINDFKLNLSDGNLFHTKGENTHFIFVPSVVQQSPVNPDKKETEDSRTFFDPFERRARTVPGGENDMSSTSRVMFVFVFDSPKPELLKVAQIKFDEFSSISKWHHMAVTFLTKLPGNRLTFMAVFDDHRYFILATNKNSLSMKVIHKGETPKKEPIMSLVQSNGYLYVLKTDRIEIAKIEDSRIAAVVDASDKQEKTEPSNKDFLRPLQTIHLQADSTAAPKSFRVYQLTNSYSLLILLSDSEVTVFAAHVFEANNNLDTARVISRYYEAAKGLIQGRLLDFEVLDRRTNQDPKNQDHPSYQILVIGIDEAGSPVNFTIPFCLPNFILHHSPEASVCKKVAVDSLNHFSLGFQNNEVHSCSTAADSLSLQRAYACINTSDIAVFALEAEQLAKQPDCLTKEAQTCPSSYRVAPKDPGCQAITDCFNCSMVPQCRWNNGLHVCDGFTDANATQSSETFKHFLSTASETGLTALDYASVKLNLDCPKPTDLRVESHQIKEYFNVSLNPQTDDQFALVVACSEPEQRLLGFLRHRRAERERAVQDKDRAVQRHRRA